jgi:hypothetical protein
LGNILWQYNTGSSSVADVAEAFSDDQDIKGQPMIKPMLLCAFSMEEMLRLLPVDRHGNHTHGG